MKAGFEVLDEFFTKFQEADKKFTVFPHPISKYGTMSNMPKLINNPYSIPIKVEDWLDCFPQAKPGFLDRELYTSVLLGCSVPLPEILKTLESWFQETYYGMWHTEIQSEICVSLGWFLFLTNNINMELMGQGILVFIEVTPVGLYWKKVSLGTQGKIPKETRCTHSMFTLTI